MTFPALTLAPTSTLAVLWLGWSTHLVPIPLLSHTPVWISAKTSSGDTSQIKASLCLVMSTVFGRINAAMVLDSPLLSAPYLTHPRRSSNVTTTSTDEGRVANRSPGLSYHPPLTSNVVTCQLPLSGPQDGRIRSTPFASKPYLSPPIPRALNPSWPWVSWTVSASTLIRSPKRSEINGSQDTSSPPSSVS